MRTLPQHLIFLVIICLELKQKQSHRSKKIVTNSCFEKNPFSHNLLRDFSHSEASISNCYTIAEENYH